MISIILPSRGRPASLARAVASLARCECEIVVGLDEDDPTADDAMEMLDYPQVRIVRSFRKTTTAQLFNVLAEHATGSHVIAFPDDYTMDQPNWSELVEKTVAILPGGYGVAYLADPMYPYFATFPILSRATIALNGSFFPPYFPFLFGDTYWNEIGVMSGLVVRSEASVTIRADTGHIHTYRDLKFWSEMYDKTRTLREDIAIKIIRAAYGEGQQAETLITTLAERKAALIRLHAPNMTQEFYDKWENKHGGFHHPAYASLKAKADKFMEIA